MKNIIKQYLTFNNRERNGIIVLLAIIVLLIVSIQLTPYLVKPPQPDSSALKSQINILEKEQVKDATDDVASPSAIEFESGPPSSSEKQDKFFNFNPNNATSEELKQLNFPDKLIHTIVNYRNKGGHFYKKEDLKKIYGLKENLYNEIEPFIVLDSANHKNSFQNEKVSNDAPLELNSADSASLVQLRGIGPSFAHRIIAYRSKLGGFCKMEQMKEIYGFDTSLYNLVVPQVDIKSNSIAKINLNTATLDGLKKHPYIKFSIANLIVNYRNQHGPYKSIEDIKKLRLVTDELYTRLEPYLSVE